ncbi:hypothetical protein AVEN_170615-1 [Araneus ventricosus]|uniref:Uncharacterized protein n=1 Tax=Araneus ventricosus TaxID=182803 RepID=A0A4Y2UNK1_ARAVE|nr:hypothetical protein AVEN_170615-1 [Araneus ventricosus]
MSQLFFPGRPKFLHICGHSVSSSSTSHNVLVGIEELEAIVKSGHPTAPFQWQKVGGASRRLSRIVFNNWRKSSMALPLGLVSLYSQPAGVVATSELKGSRFETRSH